MDVRRAMVISANNRQMNSGLDTIVKSSRGKLVVPCGFTLAQPSAAMVARGQHLRDVEIESRRLQTATGRDLAHDCVRVGIKLSWRAWTNTGLISPASPGIAVSVRIEL
jgi:hypothetical protein